MPHTHDDNPKWMVLQANKFHARLFPQQHQIQYVHGITQRNQNEIWQRKNLCAAVAIEPVWSETRVVWSRKFVGKVFAKR